MEFNPKGAKIIKEYGTSQSWGIAEAFFEKQESVLLPGIGDAVIL